MNQEPKYRNMRIFYKDKELGLFGSIACRHEIEEIVSGIKQGTVTTDEAVRRLSQ